MASEEEIADCAAHFEDLLEHSPLDEKKTFMRSFVKEVKVTGDDVLLT